MTSPDPATRTMFPPQGRIALNGLILAPLCWWIFFESRPPKFNGSYVVDGLDLTVVKCVIVLMVVGGIAAQIAYRSLRTLHIVFAVISIIWTAMMMFEVVKAGVQAQDLLASFILLPVAVGTLTVSVGLVKVVRG